jgi:hypothetical protein
MPCADNASESVEAYIDQALEYARPICRKLREIIRKTNPSWEEVLRWSSPAYRGRSLICGFSAHKHHVRLYFFQGEALQDPDGVFSCGEDDAPERTLKLQAESEIPVAKLRRLLKEAARVDASDRPKQPKARRPELPVPAELAEALDRSPRAQACFSQLPPSCRREYIEWIVAAKRSETRDRRLAQAIDLLEAGRRRYDQYR